MKTLFVEFGLIASWGLIMLCSIVYVNGRKFKLDFFSLRLIFSIMFFCLLFWYTKLLAEERQTNQELQQLKITIQTK